MIEQRVISIMNKMAESMPDLPKERRKRRPPQEEIIFTVDGHQAIIFWNRGVVNKNHLKQYAIEWARSEKIPLSGIGYTYAVPVGGLRAWQR